MTTAEVTAHQVEAKTRFRARWIVAFLIIVVLLVAVPAAVYAVFEQQYAERIFPGVMIDEFDAGGMTRNQAIATIEQHYARMLAVFDFGGAQWFAAWPTLGVTANAREAATQAYSIGREGRLDERFAMWQARRPIVITFSYDASLARHFLEQRRADVTIAPQDAGLTITAGIAVTVAAVPGRELDVDATLQDAFARILKEEPVLVHVRAVSPALGTVSEPVAQLNSWLSGPFALTLWWDNALITRTVSAQERTAWVQATRQANGYSTQINTAGIRHFLSLVNAELGPEADMRLDEATAMTQYALEQGQRSVWFVVPRRQLHYTIERGDTFESLGDRFGIPVSRILAANPDIWAAGGFAVGQAISIPAQSIMLPAPISPMNQQRIEVDLTAQRLLAYDGATVVLSTSISSGIPKWRTLVGVFQVEEKVDDAYNKLAHIHMPNWLSIYDIGDPGNSLTNGIHALPVLSGGSRLWSGYLGHPVSFGCIVMGIEDSDKLYKWVQIGTPVLVYGQTPPSSLNYDNLIEAQNKTQPLAAPTSAPTLAAP